MLMDKRRRMMGFLAHLAINVTASPTAAGGQDARRPGPGGRESGGGPGDQQRPGRPRGPQPGWQAPQGELQPYQVLGRYILQYTATLLVNLRV